MYDVGIVGASNFASSYVKALKKNKKVRNIYCFSNSTKRAKNYAKKYDIKSIDSLSELCSNNDIFAVIIANDPPSHLLFASKLLASNKHLLIEKPIDVDIKKIQEFICEAKKVRQTISVSGQYKYYSVFNKINEKIKNSAIDEFIFTNISMSLSRSISSYEKGNGWKLEFGHTSLNHAVHYLDLVLFFFGKLDSYFISQNSSRKLLNCRDTCAILLKFCTGHMVTINATTASAKTYPDIFTFVTKKRNYCIKIPRSVRSNRFFDLIRIIFLKKNPFDIQLDSFLKKAEKGTRDIESLERASLAVEIASNYFSTFKRI